MSSCAVLSTEIPATEPFALSEERRSPPLPQLLPDTHQRLNLLRAWKLLDQSAILICALIESPDGVNAEMCQVVPYRGLPSITARASRATSSGIGTLT